jgi:Arc/MetJ-type ribon-helix-helix transcriptional regulator
MSMTVSPEVAELVEKEFASGLYASTDDLLLEAVLLLRDRSERIAELRAAIQPALDRFDRGEGRPLDMARIKAAAREQYDAQSGRT